LESRRPEGRPAPGGLVEDFRRSGAGRPRNPRRGGQSHPSGRFGPGRPGGGRRPDQPGPAFSGPPARIRPLPHRVFRQPGGAARFDRLQLHHQLRRPAAGAQLRGRPLRQGPAQLRERPGAGPRAGGRLSERPAQPAGPGGGGLLLIALAAGPGRDPRPHGRPPEPGAQAGARAPDRRSFRRSRRLPGGSRLRQRPERPGRDRPPGGRDPARPRRPGG